MKVKIISLAGIVEITIRSDAKVGKLKKISMKKLSIYPRHGRRYWLRERESNLRLDDDKTLKEQGIKSGNTLYLETYPPRVG